MNAHCKQTLLPVLLVVLVACGGEPPTPAESASPGQALYLRHCASCHGAMGEGRRPSFPPLAGSEWIELPPQALGAIVLLGLRGEIEVAGERYRGFMPPLPHIDDAGLAAVVNYMKHQWAGETVDWTPEQAAALRESLAGRGMLEGRADLESLLEALP